MPSVFLGSAVQAYSPQSQFTGGERVKFREEVEQSRRDAAVERSDEEDGSKTGFLSGDQLRTGDTIGVQSLNQASVDSDSPRGSYLDISV